MTEPRVRANVFGEAAGEYEAVRPGYPEQLITDLLADAGPGPVLEVGAGTGKATAAFAARGIDLVCLEPDARMAALLSARELPRVSVVVDRFETWPPDRGYGLVFSAQAWHWIDADQRNDLAWRALAPAGTRLSTLSGGAGARDSTAPGGLLALFWNGFRLADVALHAALAEIDRETFPAGEQTAHTGRADEHLPKVIDFDEEWAELGLHDDARFTDLRSRHYGWTLRYSAADYARYLATTSLYRMLEPPARDRVLAAVTATIEKHGGRIEITVDTSAATARRA